ncbi:i/6 autoantigen-like protein [Leishmania mexicana MHOM/GT/2001/U1103]|uniref:I/6 autoantigen-like protein n=1 Tax=Leishmania mexicana (strain MHOM/GT/2001/U1103) TaxID=929439 RepID=E9AVX8_LEIMU|nr:i/6 autoantigen-like protein [Leishmania mexicana MHOM/GT/2001/U1103]CBZ27111.1 i/6 autoantigen-like protein [Leishmania mexicana MHOM/GT/2001/U1103]
MLISTRDAFEKRRITREDGIDVLPRQMITVAALEAGYCLRSPTVGEAVSKTTYPGQMTAYEFTEFCEDNRSSLMSAEDMAKCVVVVAPACIITRRSLEEIVTKSSFKKDALSEEEVDALFSILDAENKGAITDRDFMRALYGETGVHCLAARRKLDALEAKRREQEALDQARVEEEEEKKAPSEKETPKPLEKEQKKKKASACC